jgi:hypothetical protein
MIPENGEGIKRNSLLCISDFIFWLNKNKPEVFKEAVKAVDDCKTAFNDLDKHVELWRK